MQKSLKRVNFSPVCSSTSKINALSSILSLLRSHCADKPLQDSGHNADACHSSSVRPLHLCYGVSWLTAKEIWANLLTSSGLCYFTQGFCLIFDGPFLNFPVIKNCVRQEPVNL